MFSTAVRSFSSAATESFATEDSVTSDNTSSGHGISARVLTTWTECEEREAYAESYTTRSAHEGVLDTMASHALATGPQAAHMLAGHWQGQVCARVCAVCVLPPSQLLWSLPPFHTRAFLRLPYLFKPLLAFRFTILQ